MRPHWFFDIDTTGGEDSGLGQPLLRGRMLSVLHPVFQRCPHTYAVALTRGLGQLRVFASARHDIEILADQLGSLPWVRDYARLSNPRLVPTDFGGNWTTFNRYRIPTAKSDRKTGDEHGQLRSRRLKAAIEGKMDYFMLRSASTGQTFTLVVHRQPGVPINVECQPSSYGFSSAARAFSLPDLP